MKQYKIVLKDKREEFVVADTYQCVDDKYVFYIADNPIPDVFFNADSVIGININVDSWEELSKPARYRLR